MCNCQCGVCNVQEPICAVVCAHKKKFVHTKKVCVHKKKYVHTKKYVYTKKVCAHKKVYARKKSMCTQQKYGHAKKVCAHKKSMGTQKKSMHTHTRVQHIHMHSVMSGRASTYIHILGAKQRPTQVANPHVWSLTP